MADVLGEKNICKKCGKCCRLISSVKSFETLKKEADAGDSVAINFLKLFLPYENINQAKAIDEELVNATTLLNKKTFGENTETFFYYCRYLEPDNTCCVYESRPKMCCRYPKNEFVPTPKDCAYEGHAFVQREKIKSKIRKAKEQLLEIKVLRNEQKTKGELEKMNKIEKNLSNLIEQYAPFGSKDW